MSGAEPPLNRARQSFVGLQRHTHAHAHTAVGVRTRAVRMRAALAVRPPPHTPLNLALMRVPHTHTAVACASVAPPLTRCLGFPLRSRNPQRATAFSPTQRATLSAGTSSNRSAAQAEPPMARAPPPSVFLPRALQPSDLGAPSLPPTVLRVVCLAPPLHGQAAAPSRCACGGPSSQRLGASLHTRVPHAWPSRERACIHLHLPSTLLHLQQECSPAAAESVSACSWLRLPPPLHLASFLAHSTSHLPTPRPPAAVSCASCWAAPLANLAHLAWPRRVPSLLGPRSGLLHAGSARRPWPAALHGPLATPLLLRRSCSHADGCSPAARVLECARGRQRHPTSPQEYPCVPARAPQPPSPPTNPFMPVCMCAAPLPLI
jgi:hypothetical protein